MHCCAFFFSVLVKPVPVFIYIIFLYFDFVKYLLQSVVMVTVITLGKAG